MQYGFRPVNPAAAAQFKNFPVRPGQFTLADKTIGGYRGRTAEVVQLAEWLDVLDRGRCRRPVQLSAQAGAPAGCGRIAAVLEAEGERREGALPRLRLGLPDVIVALPIAALVWQSRKQGWSGFWQAISTPEAVAALKLTLDRLGPRGADECRARHDHGLGARSRLFRGKSLLNAVIDLPFALPTIVAGLSSLTFYGPDSPFGIHLAFTRRRSSSRSSS